MRVQQAVAWLTVAGTLVGGALVAEDRYANAAETKSAISAQYLKLTNSQELLANTNRLDRLQAQLRSVHSRRAGGAIYPGDDALVHDLNEEIRIAREYRSELRKQALVIK